mmetsp:Transcript_6426/g.12836  ORF Transcript_6426/g.12836 Transcript_6426/m.12836 type:complete len:211 (+) Transcript_6426:2341-2973(+)
MKARTNLRTERRVSPARPVLAMARLASNMAWRCTSLSSLSLGSPSASASLSALGNNAGTRRANFSLSPASAATFSTSAHRWVSFSGILLAKRAMRRYTHCGTAIASRAAPFSGPRMIPLTTTTSTGPRLRCTTAGPRSSPRPSTTFPAFRRTMSLPSTDAPNSLFTHARNSVIDGTDSCSNTRTISPTTTRIFTILPLSQYDNLSSSPGY